MENMVNEAATKYNFITLEEYLEMERASEEKHEYFDGYVQAMSQTTTIQEEIKLNIIGKLELFLQGNKFWEISYAMRLNTPSQKYYMYPDLQILSSRPEFETENINAETGPSVIIDIVTSPNVEFDKGGKFFFYRHIPSLKEYFMINSSRKYIHAVRRYADDFWKIEDLYKTGDSLYIETIQFNFPLDDIYRNTGL